MYYRPTLRSMVCLPLAVVACVASTLAPPDGRRRGAADILVMLYLSAIGESPCS